MLRTIGTAVLAVVAVGAMGCAGGPSPTPSVDPPPTSVNVEIQPSAIGQVWQGDKVQFTATVNGQSGRTLTWSVREGNVGGTIDSNGLYTAPTISGTYHVNAKSQGNPNGTGTASVEVVPITISIFPSPETLRIGGQRRFNGFALAANQDVTWTLQEGAAGGNITADGLYTAPSTGGTFHLIATSVFDANVSNTAPVNVVNVGFVPIGDMGTARYRHTATLLLDGRVLIVGGTADTSHSAELFVPALAAFVGSSGAMVHLRSGHCASLLPDGRVLIAGGGDAIGNLFKTAELFDPATQSFTATGDLNQARTNATATLLSSGKVIIAGGEDSSGTAMASAEVYDPSIGTFSMTGSMQTARSQHTATLLASGKVLVTGNSGGTNTAELFDPSTGMFAQTGSLSAARGHQTATLLPNGRVLILGGTQIEPPGGGGAPVAPVSIDSAEIYDPTSGLFQAAGKLLIARDSHSATLLANGTVLVAGGYSHSFDGDAQPLWGTMFAAEVFDPATSTSVTAASLGTDRAGHAATMLNSGQVLITGGVSGSQCCGSSVPYTVNLASTELYK